MPRRALTSEARLVRAFFISLDTFRMKNHSIAMDSSIQAAGPVSPLINSDTNLRGSSHSNEMTQFIGSFGFGSYYGEKLTQATTIRPLDEMKIE